MKWPLFAVTVMSASPGAAAGEAKKEMAAPLAPGATRTPGAITPSGSPATSSATASTEPSIQLKLNGAVAVPPCSSETLAEPNAS